MAGFDTAAYLRRIGLAATPAPTVDGLHALHRAQTLAIPFENFDILLGRGISLAPEALFDKMVHRPRGGYCFELNGLFLAALRALGFEARALLARVHIMGAPTGRSHQMSLVTIDGRQWIADVGFGSGTSTAPVPLTTDTPTTLPDSVRRYVDDPVFGTMLQVQTPEGWANFYSFDMTCVVDADLAMANYFTATHPSSFFTWARVAARPTPTGRVSLMDRKMAIVEGGRERVIVLDDGPPYLAMLRERFGIDLGVPYEVLRPIVGPGADFRV